MRKSKNMLKVLTTNGGLDSKIIREKLVEKKKSK